MAEDRKEYLQQYHADHKQEEAGYKGKQRQRDELILFHLKRFRRYGYPIPSTIKADTKRIGRMNKLLDQQEAEPVVVQVEPRKNTD